MDRIEARRIADEWKTKNKVVLKEKKIGVLRYILRGSRTAQFRYMKVDIACLFFCVRLQALVRDGRGLRSDTTKVAKFSCPESSSSL